jgi:hypothetical protein
MGIGMASDDADRLVRRARYRTGLSETTFSRLSRKSLPLLRLLHSSFVG